MKHASWLVQTIIARSATPVVAAAMSLFIPSLPAHEWHGDKLPEAGPEREALRAHLLQEWQQTRETPKPPAPSLSVPPVMLASNTTNLSAVRFVLSAASSNSAREAPASAASFQKFSGVKLRWDTDFLFVESNGMPDHNMMVGITAWQQQVPLPQAYFGDNAWSIPLKPVPAKEPAMIKGRFLRGAIALAVNGIPIFNPQNNRGEISYEIGELDQWGGHCGRADDYHYHIAPLHLQTQAGKGMPVAYALDGYPIYGLTEPDGSTVGKLDECHGHESPGIGYHYHASHEYPYVIGGFHGEVAEREEQVDPQPRAQGVREALQALRGAKITGFDNTGKDSYKLSYEVNGDKRSVSYAIKADGTYPFEFDDGSDGKRSEVYTARKGGGGSGPPRGGPEGMKGKGQGKGQGKVGREGEMRRDDPPPPRQQAAVEVMLDVNGDGIVTAQEFADNTKSSVSRKGIVSPEAMAKAKALFTDMDKNRNGQLEGSEWQGGLVTIPASAPSPGEDGPMRGGEEGQGRPMGGQGRQKGGPGGKGGKDSFVERPDQPRSSDGKFLLTSPVMEDLTVMPAEYTGEGESATLPLAWKGTPAGTQWYALIMDHADKEGNMKWYWTMYDIPGSVAALPRNSQGIGRMGTGFKGEVGYEPPMSKGAGSRTYVITMYALKEPLKVAGTPGREELLAAMQGKVLASSSLRVVHVSGGAPSTIISDQPVQSGGSATPPAQRAPARIEASQNTVRPPEPPTQGSGGDRPKAAGVRDEGKQGGGKAKGGPPGLVKPSIADTMKFNIYADNWFMLYVNGRLVAVDSIEFTPHNVVSVDFLPEYPMTIAVLAKDNADPKTGMEYGTSIGDGGFCLKFADGTITNASWKARNFFRGPVNGDTVNPKVIQDPLPANWWAVDFDDSTWKNAKEYTVEEVDPKQPYFDNDFEGAKFIWTDDIALDNTVIFRTKVEKPGWKQRWNTKPDLDVTGAPLR